MELRIKGIKKSFDDNNVLRDCTFDFESGKIYGLLGRNGSGKTTLFNILYDELVRDAGTAVLERSGKTDELRPEDVGMVFTENFLPEFLTGYEFVDFLLDIHGREEALTADGYLDMVGISERDRHRLLRGYSSGMASKISLLTVLVARPPVILLDEPLTAVDVVAGIEIKKLLLQLKEDHVVIMSTHILQLAEDLCDKIVLLRCGELSELDDFADEAEFERQILKALGEEGAANDAE